MTKPFQSLTRLAAAAAVLVAVASPGLTRAQDSTRVRGSFDSKIENVRLAAIAIGGGNATAATTVGGVTDGYVGGNFVARVQDVDAAVIAIGGGNATARLVVAGVQNGRVDGNFSSEVRNAKVASVAIGGGNASSSVNLGGISGHP